MPGRESERIAPEQEHVLMRTLTEAEPMIVIAATAGTIGETIVTAGNPAIAVPIRGIAFIKGAGGI